MIVFLYIAEAGGKTIMAVIEQEHRAAPLYADFTGWKVASVAGGKYPWWVCHHEKHLSVDTPKGRVRRFATFEAAKKVADEMNARPKSYYVKILTPIIVDNVSKHDIKKAALVEFKELIERVQHKKFGGEIVLEIQEV